MDGGGGIFWPAFFIMKEEEEHEPAPGVFIGQRKMIRISALVFLLRPSVKNAHRSMASGNRADASLLDLLHHDVNGLPGQFQFLGKGGDGTS